jgi:glycosyltransferase involved in cell wall biosynthesis
MFFSVIVTIYNGEAFLAPCLDSILKNPAGNYELIIVDDGSTDNSGMISDGYADRYSQVKCVHTENRGIGKARQTGLEEASGEYIIFVDGDDVWDVSFCLRKLEDIILNKPADLYVFGFIQRFVGQKGCRDLLFNIKASSFEDWREDQEHFLSYFLNGLMFPCWNKIFRRQCVINNRLAFVNQQMEDFRFVLDYLNVTRSVVFLSKEPYIYIKREKQGLTSSVHQGMLEGYSFCHCRFLSLLNEKYAELINQIMAPQYIGTAYKCLNQENHLLAKSILDSLWRNRLAQMSLMDYQPVSLSDRLSVYMIRNGLWSTLAHYRNLVTVIKRWQR